MLIIGLGLSAASHAGAAGTTGPSTLPGTTFVSGAPASGDSQPDDLAVLTVPGLDNGNPLVWTEWQNNINPNGTPGSPGGATQAVLAAYDAGTGSLVETIPVTGHVDGLVADLATDQIIATSNEDANSTFNLVDPLNKTVTTYNYTPSPNVSGNGGTDSIAILDGNIYVSHSDPNDTSQSMAYEVTLTESTHTATLTPILYDNSAAISANTGSTVTLALTDPDTNYVMPEASPRFAGALATISQGDGKIIFQTPNVSGAPGTPYVLSMTDNVPGNVPPIDGIAVATSDQGTLYVVDAGSNNIHALNTAGWPAGTVFVTEPHDNNNSLLGVLNLNTGQITPLGNSYASPKGLFFVPSLSVGSSSGNTTGTTTVTSTTTLTTTVTTTTTTSSSTALLPAALYLSVPAVMAAVLLVLLARYRRPSPALR